MKSKKYLSWLLCLSLLCTMLALPSAPVYAEESGKDSGVVLKKTATYNEADKSYTIRLEAYATGSKVVSTVTEDVPTDIVLVLDQSGSMDFCIVCGQEIDYWHNNHSTYKAVNTVDNNSRNTYYIKEGSTYTRVQYCSGSHQIVFWSEPCEGGAGWYTSSDRSEHTSDNKITPKDSAHPKGTQFYVYEQEACSSRLSALKSAATGFVNAVAAKAAGPDGDITTTADNINHRIAVVGFASKSGYGNNTELLSISGTNSGNVGVAYNNISEQNLKDVMQSMDTSAGQNMVSSAINALVANGATRTDLGVDMAQRILEQNPVGENEKRNRVVIVFTDGVPTSSDSYDSGVAKDAISSAKSIKNAKATVYTIGIFSGADATSAGDQNGNETQKANWFMQQISSNNGKPQDPSYYLSAADAGTLNNIFQQISDQIESGGATTELTETSVIKDVVTPYFDLPADSEKVKLYTADSDGGYDKWKDPVAFNGTVDIDEETSTVGVSGFNFKENWCGEEVKDGTITTFHNGKKLIIEFTVKPKEGFLGGNGVPTNESAGIYENADAKEPVVSATVDPVDVQIKDVVIKSLDTNVYLGAQYGAIVNGSDIKNNMRLTIGGVEVDLTKPAPNYGLADWQKKYVNIEVKITDINGREVQYFEMLDDQQYKVTVTVKPTETGTATEETGEDNGTIHVFTPELTFKDGNVDYQSSIGNTAYTSNGSDKSYAAYNYVSSETKWTHIDETTGQKMVAGSEGVTMLGDQPELFLSYEPTSGVTNGKVTATDYVRVKVTVKLNDANGPVVTNKTTFVHQCDVNVAGGCQWNDTTMKDGNPAFLLHVINVVGDLTITKNGLNVGTYAGTEDQESAIFKVEGDNQTWYVAINANASGTGSVTLTGLKVGDYTVTELTDWTWRYGSSTLTSDNKNDDGTFKVNGGQMTTVTCANSDHNDKWLGGDNYANNVFGSGN